MESKKYLDLEGLKAYHNMSSKPLSVEDIKTLFTDTFIFNGGDASTLNKTPDELFVYDGKGGNK